MASSSSNQLETLHRELERLEQLLMLDASWRELRRLEHAAAAGAGDAESIARARAQLMRSLSGNRVFVEREKLLETIDLLLADRSGTDQSPLSSRIVTLAEPGASIFRARIRMKPPDALGLIDGLGPHAVEQLMDAGITRYADIARWTSADVLHWRTRLDGLAHGTPGSWIEQAAVLETGRLTHFAEQVRGGELAAVVPAPMPTPEPERSAGSAAALSSLTPRKPCDSLATTAPSAVKSPPQAATKRMITAEDLIRTLGTMPETDSEVSVIAGSVAPAQAPAAADLVPARHKRLLQRLKGIRVRDRFEASSYAAYRGAVEEASVTIIRPDIDVPDASISPPRPIAKSSGQGPRTIRFLRVLTGRIGGNTEK